MSTQNNTLQLTRNNFKIDLAITSNDAAHAQAQSCDIARALGADRFSLTYKKTAITQVSELFRKLAYSEFSYKKCDIWKGRVSLGLPVFYALGRRYYVRPTILDYLDVHRDNYVEASCGCGLCINPLHNAYKKTKASKLTSAETKLALAFAGQGTPIKDIAQALKVHRSTIYRILKHERFYPRSPGD